jgi:hypothetical protein
MSRRKMMPWVRCRLAALLERIINPPSDNVHPLREAST